jgi:hypothetical protein
MIDRTVASPPLLWGSPCVFLSHLHPNGIFSQDSQSGVPKLSRYGLPELWAFITSLSNLRLGQGLKQTCSSPWELSKGVSHSTCTHRDQVNSRLFVVGSQTTNWLPALLFPITCAIDVQMVHARPFWTFTLQDLSDSINNTSMWMFWPLQSSSEFLGVPKDSKWRTPNSLRDSNVSPSKKQQKREELEHTP